MTSTTPAPSFMDELYDAAITYLDRGWSIFPVVAGDKRPLIKWEKYQEAPPTPDEVESWFVDGVHVDGGVVREFNLGIVTGAVSGIVVVDADNDDATRAAYERGLTSPYVVRTPRGTHFYFRHPGEMVKNQAGKSIRGGTPGLDVRGDGGFVVAPPSWRASDGGVLRYQWDQNTPDFDDLDLHPYPSNVTPAFALPANALPSLAHVPMLGGVAAELDFLTKRGQQKIRQGQRNVILTKWLGEQVRKAPGDYESMARDMMAMYFEELLDDTEMRTVVRSVCDMDRRNHPHDYDASGERVVQQAPDLPGTLIHTGNADALDAARASKVYLLDPLIPHPSIVQVYGYTGHGKSQFTRSALFAVAAGATRYAGWAIERKAKVLYIDAENYEGDLTGALRNLAKQYGDPGEDFHFWKPEQSLSSRDGLAAFEKVLKAIEPEVVVFDTLRTCFDLGDENKAESWNPVNRLATQLRDAGITVVMMHHANKPNEAGTMSEAGSTNQLTCVETQIKVTLIPGSQEEADEKVATFNDDVALLHGEKRLRMQNYLHASLGLLMRVSYKKVRAMTPNHRALLVGMGIRMNGEIVFAGDRSPRLETAAAIEAAVAAGKTRDQAIDDHTAHLWQMGKAVTRELVEKWADTP